MKTTFFILCGVVFLVRLWGKFEMDHSWGIKDYIQKGKSGSSPKLRIENSCEIFIQVGFMKLWDIIFSFVFFFSFSTQGGVMVKK